MGMFQSDYIDRRSSPRYASAIDGEIIYSGLRASVKEKCKILNASKGGCLITTGAGVKIDEPASVNFHMPFTGDSVQFMGRIIWTKESDGGKFEVGLIFKNLLGNSEIEKLIGHLSLQLTHSERRQSVEDGLFPLRNRTKDYKESFFQSPYHSFFSLLSEISKEQKIDNIIICSHLAYLQKRIRKVFLKPRILLTEELNGTLQGRTLLIIDLAGRRKHEAFTFLDFEEYKMKGGPRNGPLKTLAAVSRNLGENSHLTILTLGAIKDQTIVTKHLRITKFHKINFEGDHLIHVEKRPLFQSLFHHGHYELQEVQSIETIRQIHQFAEKMYSDGYNFREEIDDMFTDHSDFYIVKETKTGKMVNFARIAMNLPNCFLPCMLANKKGTDLHLQLYKPDELYYGEFFAPYLKSLAMTRTYSELVKRFVSYGPSGMLHVAFTTYVVHQKRDFDFLSRYLGFREANCTLNYGDFGGDWNLIYTTMNMLQENIRLNFQTPTPSARIIKSLIET